MAKIAVEQIDGADHNGSAETENKTLTNRLETVSNLQLAVRPALELELVTETDRSISFIAGLGEVVNISVLSDDDLAKRCQRLGDFFKVLSGKMTLHTAWLAGESFSEEKRRLEVKQSAKGKKTSHGTWMKHLATKYPTLEGRTIRNWMGVFENKGKLQDAGILQLTAAYKQVKQWNALAKGKPVKKGKKEKTPEQVMGDVVATVKKFNTANPDKANELFGFIAELEDKKSTLQMAKNHIQHYFETFGQKDIAALQTFIYHQAKARQEADKAPKPVAVTQKKEKAPRKSKAQKEALLRKEEDKEVKEVENELNRVL